MKFRDIELLSSYLDGQLSASESERLETRLSSDPNLRAVMDDLREARGLLRRLPARKAPRNFTVTRQMVGLKPPLPRAYPTFRFATALATILLVVTFAINALGPSLSRTAAAPAPAYGMGGGGGGAPEFESQQATEAPAATEAPVEPSLAMPMTATAAPTAAPSAADSAQPFATESLEEAPTEAPVPPNAGRQSPVGLLVPVTWQIVLAIIGVLSGVIAFLMRRAAVQKWK